MSMAGNFFGGLLGIPDWSANSWGQLANQFLSWNDKENPYDESMNYLERIQPYAEQQYAPYQQAGQLALAQLLPEYSSLSRNPSGAFGKLGGDIYGENFQESPGYQFQVDQAMNANNAAMAAAGLTGSSAHNYGAMNTANQLANQDYYKYLNQQMQISNLGKSLYGMGLGGLSNINQMGFNATNQLTRAIQEALMAQAGVSARQQGWQNENSGIFGAIGGLF